MQLPSFGTLALVRGAGPQIPFNFTQDDGRTARAIDPAATVRIKAYTSAGLVLFDRTAIAGATADEWIFAFTASDTSTKGSFYAELSIEITGQEPQKWIGSVLIGGAP